jgi:hypothetical protein
MGCEPVNLMRGLCHGKKTEQAGCIASAQPIFQSIDKPATNFQLILIVDSFQSKQELVDFLSSNAFSVVPGHGDLDI